MIWLTEEDVLHLHQRLIEKFGGQAGLRDYGMLSSSLLSPLQTFDGKDLYQTTLEKIARLSFCLVSNHPFLDGNKRIGAFVLNILMQANDLPFEVTDQDMIDEFLSLASGRVDFPSHLSWVRKHGKV